MKAKILAAALGLLVVGGAVADASAAVVTKTTKTVVHSIVRPAVAKKVTIVHRVHRPHLVRVLPQALRSHGRFSISTRSRSVAQPG